MTREPDMPDLPLGDERDISPILEAWQLQPGTVTARRILGEDGTEQIQLRIPMGMLQLYPDGRPDGAKPEGFPTALDWLRRLVEQERKEPTPEQWFELDREIMQYYHRRIAMLSLAEAERREHMLDQAARDFSRVVRDADHNLQIMDFIKQHSTDNQFIGTHEQYRSFVLGHRTLGAGLYWICRNEPEEALDVIHVGLKRLEQAYEDRGDSEMLRRDPIVGRLVRLADQLRKDHSIAKTLHEELADAVAAEEFERAAGIRDRIRERMNRLQPPFRA